MATFWIISFAGVFIGFMMVYFNAQCSGVEKIYPDIFYFYSDHPLPRPSRISVFYKIILVPWVLSMILLTQGERKKLLDKEISIIRQINEELKKRQASADEKNSGNQPHHSCNSEGFSFTTDGGIQSIAFADIYYISVSDHYSELVIRKGQSYQLQMDGTGELIPASRHRAQDFLPRLKQILDN